MNLDIHNISPGVLGDKQIADVAFACGVPEIQFHPGTLLSLDFRLKSPFRLVGLNVQMAIFFHLTTFRRLPKGLFRVLQSEEVRFHPGRESRMFIEGKGKKLKPPLDSLVSGDVLFWSWHPFCVQ